MTRRWVCPNCRGGVLAVSRPRMDDVRRYCLPCSKSTGRLVKRICPAQERRVAAKRAAVKEGAVRARERERAREERLAAQAELARSIGAPEPFEVRAESIRGDLRAWARLAAWQADLSDVELVIRRRTREPLGWTSGHCDGTRRIVITVGVDRAQARETLLHEMAHAAEGRFRRPRPHAPGDGVHGVTFRSLLLTAAAEVLGRRVVPGGTSTRDADLAVSLAFAAVGKTEAAPS